MCFFFVVKVQPGLSEKANAQLRKACLLLFKLLGERVALLQPVALDANILKMQTEELNSIFNDYQEVGFNVAELRDNNNMAKLDA